MKKDVLIMIGVDTMKHWNTSETYKFLDPLSMKLMDGWM